MTELFDYLVSRPDVVTSIFAALATLFAAIATWSGPQAAARLSEKLRERTEDQLERRRIKYSIFSTLMQERAQIYSQEAVRALNLIDVAFNDSRSVREAWFELFTAFDKSKGIPAHAQDERLRHLLQAMSNELGLGDGFRSDDFNRVYYPDAIAREQRLKALQQEALIRELQGGSSPSANSAPVFLSSKSFPPRPNN